MKKNSYLFIALMFAVAISKAQSIPNAGFETWTSMGSYNNPDNWSTFNDGTASMSVFTCLKGTPGNPGSSYMKLVSKTVGTAVTPGIAVCGTLSNVTNPLAGGFPFNQRPQYFTGSWQHMIFGSSQGYVNAMLTHWDAATQSRVTVATAIQFLSGMAMSWANFSIPFNYTNGNAPDSCIIVLAASGSNPTNNDYLYVDNLGFSGTVSGINTIDISKNISVYPIPASNNLTVNLSALQEKNVSIQITDMQGKLTMTLNKVEVSANASIDISSLQKGNYILEVLTANGTGKINFVKQ